MLGEFEFADDLRPHERHHVGEREVLEPGEDLFGDRGAAHKVPALKDEDPVEALREVSGAYEAVVASSDDDGVIGLSHASGAYPTTAELSHSTSGGQFEEALFERRGFDRGRDTIDAGEDGHRLARCGGRNA